MDKNNNIAKDFGNWTVPTKWEEITLKQFSDIKRYLNDNGIGKFDVRTVLHILCNKTEDEVNALPVDFAEALLRNLTFMQNEPKVADPTNKITISGDTYIINVQEKLKLGEYVACDSAMKADKYDYPSILAILCRKENEPFDSYFQNEVYDERKKMFESLPMTEGMRLIAFFLQCWIISEKSILKSLKGEVKESLNHIAQIIENSTEIGAGKKLYMSWRMKKLKKLLK